LYEHAASPAVAEDCQQGAKVFIPNGGTPARLSSQLPACPLVPEHRMMMFDSKLLPAQYAPLAGVAGQVKVPSGFEMTWAHERAELPSRVTSA